MNRQDINHNYQLNVRLKNAMQKWKKRWNVENSHLLFSELHLIIKTIMRYFRNHPFHGLTGRSPKQILHNLAVGANLPLKRISFFGLNYFHNSLKESEKIVWTFNHFLDDNTVLQNLICLFLCPIFWYSMSFGKYFTT